MAKKLVVVKVNTKTRNAVKIVIDNKPEAVMAIVGQRHIAGRDLLYPDGTILRLCCHSAPADDAVRWTLEGDDIPPLGGWLRGDAVLVGYDRTAKLRAQPGVIDVPFDAAYINARIRWFNPETDSIGPAEENDGADVDGDGEEAAEAE